MTGFDPSAGFGGLQSYALMVLIFAGFFLAFEAVFLSLARRTATRSDLKRRLSKSEDAKEPHETLVKMRRKRSLSPHGEYTMPMIWLNRLVVQSGVTWGVAGLPLVLTVGTVVVFAAILLVGGNPFLALFCASLLGIVAPLLFLALLARRRRQKFERQLPDAIDILVRGLKVGHPVPTAIRVVARELPDPIGSEFAIVADELTYGLDLETATSNLSARVGQQDLTLVVVAIGIQAKSGGNLAEILTGLSKVIRDRLRMRLKVKALSAEGRFSALLLSILPIALFGLLWVIAPHFYGEVWHVALVKPILLGALAWMAVGDLVMYRMVKFQI